ncbi:serine O-acetyltransferase EpsC [Halobaculum gomorrense]|uniref:serine O-acetyltransferase n=1 Tax=Halobaculum gomorrense TaxID=43928 RepID=A0A1M5PDL7_9EURY|nr:serine O-acetyltransferase EpsC [Halobaculum gomorrense]SHG99363.1 serine O-acetyltransferase [Halobaculum gomorrense]
MQYSYDGTASTELFEAYGADEDPFPTPSGTTFPPRTNRCEEVNVLKRLLFPACWNAGPLTEDPAEVRAQLNELGGLFAAGIEPYTGADPTEIVDGVFDQLPRIRDQLKKDITAAYKGDPAAKTYLEIIRSYPGFHAVMIQRVAHALYEADAPEYARELTEYAKAVTGIDIHPGAELGEYCFIDHGTGVVIGETATVGDWVRIYQDVTLGALHFEEDETDGKALKKGYKRHPDVGDNVVIGAGTKVLGPITVGDHVSIGANSWVTQDVPDHTSVYVADHPKQERKPTD